MPSGLSEAFWLHEHYQFSLDELAELAGLTAVELRHWVEEGLVAPVDLAATPWRFSADRLFVLQRACRLRRDFELEPHGLALVLRLLERIEELETEMRALRARLPGI